MTTASYRNPAAAFLHRAGLLAGLLAIIAGIFGMHVMTGTHNGHSAAAVAAAIAEGPAGSTAADGHRVHLESGATSDPTTGVRDDATTRDTAGTPAQMCSCADCGTAVQAMGGSCIPSVKTVSLASLTPGSTVFGVLPPTGAAGTVLRDWSHVPGTPSPGELSISRT